jgi:hypothetical protein
MGELTQCRNAYHRIYLAFYGFIMISTILGWILEIFISSAHYRIYNIVCLSIIFSALLCATYFIRRIEIIYAQHAKFVHEVDLYTEFLERMGENHINEVIAEVKSCNSI